jgi:hypothetical protein
VCRLRHWCADCVIGVQTASLVCRLRRWCADCVVGVQTALLVCRLRRWCADCVVVRDASDNFWSNQEGNLKVFIATFAGAIPDGVIGIFHWHNPSGHTMARGSTQPLTEMSTRNIFWGWNRPVRRADNLTTFMGWLSWNLGASTFWNTQGLSRPVRGLLYLFFATLD